jgi:leucyl aminopeptidase
VADAKPPGTIAAVFFDLGDTLGTATLGGNPRRLLRFDVFPFLLPSPHDPNRSGLLAELKARGLRLGVISNTGDEGGAAVTAILQPTGLLTNLDATLLVYSGDEGVTKASSAFFDRAAIRAGLPATRCLYVGEDPAERGVAIAAGWAVCPHPLLVAEVLDSQSLRYVRLTVPEVPETVPWRMELRKRAFVPQHLTGPGGTTVYGLTSQRVALELMNMRFGVELLGEPDLPQMTDLYLLRDDLARQSGFLSPQGGAARAFAAAGAERLIVSTTAEGVVAALPAGRGPDAFHFDNARHGHNLKLTPDPMLWDAPLPIAAPAGFAPERPTLAPAAAEELTRIDPTVVLRTVERYSGQHPLDGSEGGTLITSRHILGNDSGNARAVDQLVADLEGAGRGRFQIRLHPFTHFGRTFHNVEAELTGGSPELVLVTAHMDSTAAKDDNFNPETSPAPGADDDASGVAGVLAIAERLAILAEVDMPARTIRFVMFNAEEQGLVGSAAYARRTKARGEAVAAVWQMDMIGFNAAPPRDWEIHAGFQSSPAMEARCRRLAELLAAVAPQAAPGLPTPQIYDSLTLPNGDEADGRSDHTSFQAQGFPAVAVSEDLFPDGRSAPDGNPNYHKKEDLKIDSDYGALIARAVAAAAWLSASGGTV